jgi:hypothetical protein
VARAKAVSSTLNPNAAPFLPASSSVKKAPTLAPQTKVSRIGEVVAILGHDASKKPAPSVEEPSAPVSTARGFNVAAADRLNKQLTLEALLDPDTVVLECSDRASFFYGVMEDARAKAGLVELAREAACMKEAAQKEEEAQKREAAAFSDMLKNAQRRYEVTIREKERAERERAAEKNVLTLIMAKGRRRAYH